MRVWRVHGTLSSACTTLLRRAQPGMLWACRSSSCRRYASIAGRHCMPQLCCKAFRTAKCDSAVLLEFSCRQLRPCMEKAIRRYSCTPLHLQQCCIVAKSALRHKHVDYALGPWPALGRFGVNALDQLALVITTISLRCFGAGRCENQSGHAGNPVDLRIVPEHCSALLVLRAHRTYLLPG